ncbi:ribose-5-phosphate isomerase RpiA [bacterium]|nr:ribose-5-phosphate isomerase RpiA [bacterium]
MSKPKTKEDHDAEKRLAAEFVVRWVADGMHVGLGSGSTAAYFIESLGKRMKEENLRITGIATSKASEALARVAGIPVIEPFRGLHIDVAIDGADEIDPSLTLIKGGGGALLREKVIANNASHFLVIADSSKWVTDLGKFPLPIEVVPFAVPLAMDYLVQIGGNPVIRRAKLSDDIPAMTDQGNHLIDCHFLTITDPVAMSRSLLDIPGVVDHGLFIGLATVAIIASAEKVVAILPDQKPMPADQFSLI